MTFIGHYPELVDDRIGSRVGDRCWAAADPYLKVRPISPWLWLGGLKSGAAYTPRRPAPAPVPKSAASKAEPHAKPTEEETWRDKEKKAKRKRGEGPGDEIDDLFEQTLGKKVKRAALASSAAASEPAAADKEEAAKPSKEEKKKRKGEKGKVRDDGLGDVLGAIKAAPKGEEPKRKKHKS
ncbi:hypothetical protein EVG20_g11321 [Dentipellis fragilis]|uniref:Uncharacterized protein n=1 Tax=Dentipellis fragilis TaxID=205917 RepID=A0A4Y9XN58_9AGAM|nr:hypothetical protein EVG20_g11321 [Dentipellis fragilis]